MDNIFLNCLPSTKSVNVKTSSLASHETPKSQIFALPFRQLTQITELPTGIDTTATFLKDGS